MFDKFSGRHIGVTRPEDLKAMLDADDFKLGNIALFVIEFKIKCHY